MNACGFSPPSSCELIDAANNSLVVWTELCRAQRKTADTLPLVLRHSLTHQGNNAEVGVEGLKNPEYAEESSTEGFGQTESSSLIKVHNFSYPEAIPHYNGHGIPWRDVSSDSGIFVKEVQNTENQASSCYGWWADRWAGLIMHKY